VNPNDDGPGTGHPPWAPDPTPAGPPPPATPPPGGPRHPAGAGGWGVPPPASPPPAAGSGGWGAAGWGAPIGPSGAWTPTPPRKRRLGWLAIVLGLLWAGAITAAVFLGLFFFRMFAPMNATSHVLEHLEDRRYQAAYDASCSAERAAFTEREFEAAMRSLIRRHGAIDDTGVSSADLHGGSEATVRYWIRFEDSGRREYQTLVVKEDGDWRPCLLSENPHS